jgi:hypothetical protein
VTPLRLFLRAVAYRLALAVGQLGGYRNSPVLALAGYGASLFVSAPKRRKRARWTRWVSWALLAASTLLLLHSFFPVALAPILLDVHLWAYVSPALSTLTMLIDTWPKRSGLPWWQCAALALSVYPGGVLFKGLVNIGTGQPFLTGHEVTDDPTGKTFGIPSMGLKIPRLSSGWVRLTLAMLSIGLILTIEHCHGKRYPASKPIVCLSRQS